MYYVYDPETKIFEYTSSVYVENSTTVSPPDDNDWYTLSFNGSEWVFDQDLLDAYIQKQNEVRQEKYLKKLSDLCDFKTHQAFEYLTGNPYSQLQVDRYKQKYEMAKAFLDGNTSLKDEFSLEAKIQGVTVTQLCTLIVSLGDQYKKAMGVFMSRIEAFRVAVKKMIFNNEFVRVRYIIGEAYKLGADATDETIQNLLNYNPNI